MLQTKSIDGRSQALRRAQDSIFASKIEAKNLENRIQFSNSALLQHYFFGFIGAARDHALEKRLLRQRQSRGLFDFVFCGPKEKLRSSLCVLYRRMIENWKIVWLSGWEKFDAMGWIHFKTLLGLLQHYFILLRTCFQNSKNELDFKLRFWTQKTVLRPALGGPSFGFGTECGFSRILPKLNRPPPLFVCLFVCLFWYDP